MGDAEDACGANGIFDGRLNEGTRKRTRAAGRNARPAPRAPFVNPPPRPDFKIRRARPSDLGAVDAIEGASFTIDRFSRRTFARLLKSPAAAFVIAEAEGRPLGYLLLLFRKGAKAARLYSLATVPGARGGGVGTSLVQAGAQCAIERGCDRLRLEVRASNDAAITLYERAGFRIVDRLSDYYDDGATALRMERRLGEERESGAR